MRSVTLRCGEKLVGHLVLHRSGHALEQPVVACVCSLMPATTDWSPPSVKAPFLPTASNSRRLKQGFRPQLVLDPAVTPVANRTETRLTTSLSRRALCGG